ncbi:hypothetical protein CkaCkLH20_10418 [Colletotrichum karsti]|uniref:T6SS Phospholipase effector Tle1-like catalytic domain-containing protein n=1 Tax=Colletotrichum karsti TaxID=1095194 RepID=A0A9P6HZK5_9PEZI|nr:uncharacterized protein CkaCkLH20_10418 [Colletotrichum karsti]KAF9872081.1 hypothetical protein CkaCkLH20_10418 [Colletotrichum karsti]
MSFSSHHSDASVGTALSSPMDSPIHQDFASGRWNRTPGRRPRNLILCFDGTGNDFSGTEKDTNVVKLLSMLDRRHEEQYHYYQTGIGTYGVNEKTIHKTWLQDQWGKVTSTLDEGFGMTFDSHVVAGYRFLMQYYEEGDNIYMFGFSRGAYTAKFLARMVNTVGLLCRGNEEMVPFAYRLYDRYLDGEFSCRHNKDTEKQKQEEGRDQDSDDDEENHKTHHVDDCHESDHRSIKQQLKDERDNHQRNARTKELKKFSNTFCRKEVDRDRDRHRAPGKKPKLVNVKVHFLGLWDCVNSVSVMERKATREVLVHGTARIIRHAVAVDERRVKFKAALFEQDKKIQKKKKHYHEDIKEVWFPGNHGDVGGGWDPKADKLRTDDKTSSLKARFFGDASDEAKGLSYQKECLVCKDCGLCKADDRHHAGRLDPCREEYSRCRETECRRCHEDVVCQNPLHTRSKRVEFEPCQLSDTPLMWMMKELEEEGGVHWDAEKVNEFRHRYEHNKDSALEGSVHDPVMFGMGTKWTTVLFWNFLEFFPLIKRWELDPVPFWSRLAFWRTAEPAVASGTDGESSGKWEWVQFPLNKGSTRDIPPDAVFHHSLIIKLKTHKYRPENNHGGKGKEPCLWDKEVEKIVFKEVEKIVFKDASALVKGKPQPHLGHQLYQLSKGGHAVEA